MAKSSLDAMAVSFLLCCNPYLTLMLQQRAGLLLLLLLACEEQAGGVGWNCTSQVTSRLHKLLFFCVFLAVFLFPSSSLFLVAALTSVLRSSPAFTFKTTAVNLSLIPPKKT